MTHPMTASPWERWRPLALAVVTFGAVLLRLVLIRVDDGLIYPDEVHQSLEQAHRLAFGSGLIPWEFEVGARCWALAGALAGVMKVGAWAGVAPQLAARVVLALASGATAWACARLVRTFGGAAVPQLLAAVSWAALNLAVLLGTRGLSESALTFPLVLGLAWALETKSSKAQLLGGAALLTLAVMFRLQVAVFALGAAATVLARRDVARARWLLGGLAGGVVVMGLLDLATWGSFLHSARAYLRFNLLEGRASEFGVMPRSYYLAHLWASMGLVLPALTALSLLSRRAVSLFAMVVVFVVLHQVTPHKELRFLLPALPLVAVLAALGVEALSGRPLVARLAAAGLLGALLLGQPRLPKLTFRMLGVPDASDVDAPALDAAGPENRLLAEAGRHEDVCGVEVKTRQLGYTGATTWLHRDIPLYGAEKPPANPRSVNAVIARRGEGAGLIIASDQDLALFRLDHDPCAPASDFDGKLH